MLGNLKIGTRLALGFGLIVLFILLMVVFAFRGLSEMQHATNRLANGIIARQMAASSALAYMQEVVRSVNNIVVLKDPAAQAKEKEKIKGTRAKYAENMKQLEELIAKSKVSNQKEKEMLDRIKGGIKPAAEANNRAVALASAGKRDEALEVLAREAIPLCDTLFASFYEMAAYQKEQIAARYEDAVKTAASTRWVLGIGSLAVIGAAIVLALFITLGITRPLSSMLAMLRDVAYGEGDLTKRLDESRRDELGDTSRLFNQFIAKIHDIITQIARAADTVAAASGQLQTTSCQIAAGTEEVAGKVSAVATAGEEMSQTSGDIARNCVLVSDASRQAAESATSGAGVVNQTISGMELIAERVQGSAKTVEALGARSDQIGAIVGTIEDIADQTNLLALNAAIEAARAGEQGRGFAVVADEVRALAERTTKATCEIGQMIKAIQKETGEAVGAMEQGVQEVEKGAVTSRESGQALEDILQRIHEVSMQVSQIATAAEEQTATTGEITTNIHRVTDMMQQTAQNADETAAAAAQLSSQAQQLQILVGRFRLA